MKLNTDKKTAAISIVGDLTTAQVEKLIADLAELRASMQPEVSVVPPGPGGLSNDRVTVSLVDDPYLSARPLKDGRVRLWLRNGGLGWMIFNLSIEKACALRDFLIANTPASPGEHDLFRDGGGDSGPRH